MAHDATRGGRCAPGLRSAAAHEPNAAHNTSNTMTASATPTSTTSLRRFTCCRNGLRPTPSRYRAVLVGTAAGDQLFPAARALFDVATEVVEPTGQDAAVTAPLVHVTRPTVTTTASRRVHDPLEHVAIREPHPGVRA